MFEDLASTNIISFHDKCHRFAGWPEAEIGGHIGSDVWFWVEKNHRYNSQLWLEEDLARRRSVSDSEIAANKRNIDRFNQSRNDAIEQLDEIILSRLSRVELKRDAWLNSETAGSIVDRLSIMSLKIYNMGRLASGEYGDLAAQVEAEEKKRVFVLQRENLGLALDNLLSSAALGSSFYKIFRQYKMYNDVRFNPLLVAESRTGS